jgi:hypothetical protein
LPFFDCLANILMMLDFYTFPFFQLDHLLQNLNIWCMSSLPAEKTVCTRIVKCVSIKFEECIDFEELKMNHGS